MLPQASKICIVSEFWMVIIFKFLKITKFIRTDVNIRRFKFINSEDEKMTAAINTVQTSRKKTLLPASFIRVLTRQGREGASAWWCMHTSTAVFVTWKMRPKTREFCALWLSQSVKDLLFFGPWTRRNITGHLKWRCLPAKERKTKFFKTIDAYFLTCAWQNSQ